MAKFINKMKDLMFGEYEDDEDYYEDDYEYEAPAREAAPVSNNYGLRDVSRESDYSTTLRLAKQQETIRRFTASTQTFRCR